MNNFDKINAVLMSNDPVVGLQLMADSGELFDIFPELHDVYTFNKEVGKYHHLPLWNHTLEVVRNTSARSQVRWAALFHDVAKPVCWSKTDTGVHYYGHDREGARMWSTIAKRI